MKSFVTMEKKIYTVCGKEFKTNSILMDKRLREVPMVFCDVELMAKLTKLKEAKV